MNKTLRALAALLAYPEEGLIDALPEIEAVVSRDVLPLVRELKGRNLFQLQESYVGLFDRSRALSLHLFEHVHGDSRERGQAMVDLRELYALHGLDVAGHELPDYIPAFLEFASVAEREQAKGLLQETAHIFRALGERLAERGSPYAGVFAALLAMAGEKGLKKISPSQPAGEDLKALEREWMDPEVTFGGPQPVRFYRKGVTA